MKTLIVLPLIAIAVAIFWWAHRFIGVGAHAFLASPLQRLLG